MAYAAVISLKHTIHRLLNSSRISIFSSDPQIIESAYEELESLQQVLIRLDDSRSSSSARLNALDGQIREAVYAFEDALESHVTDQFLSLSESHGDEAVRQEIKSFVEIIMKMKVEYTEELDNPLPAEEDDEDDAVSSRIDSGGKKSKMVGFSESVRKIMGLIGSSVQAVRIVSIVGMAGIGKTTLAKQIFEDPFHVSYFECRAWVTVGRNRQLKQILLSILLQMDPGNDKMLIKGDEISTLRKILMEKRYLIVLDDIWELQVWKDLKDLFAYKYDRSGVLLTTRLQEVALLASGGDPVVQMQLLNNEESWCLFRQKVFGKMSCPPQLEKAGKKIAENCEGLPLTIVTVADLLSRAEKTPEHWNKLIAEKQNSVFKNAYDQMAKVLYPSYNYLPQYLKPCFLYMGVCPQNYEIPRSKLVRLWIAEGFLEPNPSKPLEDFASECLEKLHSSSLVMIRQQSSSGGIKTCSLHSVFFYLCSRESTKIKFFHGLNGYADCLAKYLESQRRLSIYSNTLLGINDMHNSITSISTVRSLLCTGPPLQYPVPICFGLRLLRVLDALAIRFYEFPIQVLKLVQLRYLALTFNGDLHSSISKLRNLQFLIVRRHLSVKSYGALSYLPMEIWDMKELKHLQVMGINLPDPNGNALLPNLLTLLDVSAHSCTKNVLARIPNLEKLGIQIELVPDAAEVPPPLSCFDHISLLKKLKSLKCVIVNPVLRSEVVAPPPRPLPNFPSGLQKLSLSGLGYPWEEMSKIASLPNLEVLKLRNYAFRGPKWKVYDKEFSKLKYLLIEDTDLVEWTAAYNSFSFHKRIIIKNCYRLTDIPVIFWKNVPVDLVDCNPSAAILKEPVRIKPYQFQIHTQCSWEDGKLKS